MCGTLSSGACRAPGGAPRAVTCVGRILYYKVAENLASRGDHFVRQIYAMTGRGDAWARREVDTPCSDCLPTRRGGQIHGAVTTSQSAASRSR